MKTMFLLSHTPIPRFLKRINIANEVGKTKLLYWDRVIKNDVKFTLESGVECESIKLKAPTGQPFKRSLILFLFIFRALIVIKEYKPDNLHIGNFDMLLIAFIYKTLFHKNVKVIYEVGDLPEIIFKNNMLSSLYKKIESILMKKVKNLILTSPYYWEVYYKNITEAEKYIFIPNVPSKKILENSLRKNELESNQNKEKLTIGFIGSVRYEKQLKMLIDIIKYMKNINLLIAGTGKALETLKTYSVDHKNVHFTGAYDYKEIGSLYSRIDIAFSVYDTNKANVKVALPNRLYEAILFEKPLIVSKGTKLSNFVLTNDIGYQVSDNNPKDLRELLINIGHDKSLLTTKQENCRIIKEKYVYETYIPKIKRMYMRNSLIE